MRNVIVHGDTSTHARTTTQQLRNVSHAFNNTHPSTLGPPDVTRAVCALRNATPLRKLYTLKFAARRSRKGIHFLAGTRTVCGMAACVRAPPSTVSSTSWPRCYLWLAPSDVFAEYVYTHTCGSHVAGSVCDACLRVLFATFPCYRGADARDGRQTGWTATANCLEQSHTLCAHALIRLMTGNYASSAFFAEYLLARMARLGIDVKQLRQVQLYLERT